MLTYPILGFACVLSLPTISTAKGTIGGALIGYMRNQQGLYDKTRVNFTVIGGNRDDTYNIESESEYLLLTTKGNGRGAEANMLRALKVVTRQLQVLQTGVYVDLTSGVLKEYIGDGEEMEISYGINYNFIKRGGYGDAVCFTQVLEEIAFATKTTITKETAGNSTLDIFFDRVITIGTTSAAEKALERQLAFLEAHDFIPGVGAPYYRIPADKTLTQLKMTGLMAKWDMENSQEVEPTPYRPLVHQEDQLMNQYQEELNTLNQYKEEELLTYSHWDPVFSILTPPRSRSRSPSVDGNDGDYEWAKVQKVLADAGCSEKMNTFREEGIVTMDIVFALTSNDLKDMGFNIGMKIRLRGVVGKMSPGLTF
jgi:hypothetical protein